MKLRAGHSGINRHQPTGRPLTYIPSCWSVVLDLDLNLVPLLPRISPNQWDPTKGVSVDPQGVACLRVWAFLGSIDTMFGSFLKDPWLVLEDVCPDFSKPNMILYEFITSHMIFIQNEHVNFDETCLDTQDNFKEHLSNVMDVLGCLTSKLHKAWQTAYMHNNNSFMDLKTS